jgi:hypothetical protein
MLRKALAVFVTLMAYGLTPVEGFAADDGRSIQVGYAIVTPISPVPTNGIAVFETFGLRWFGGAAEVGLLPSEMTTQAMIFVRASERLSRNMGIAVANPAGAPTSVTMTLRDTEGTVIASKTIMMTAFQQTARFVSELFADADLRDFTGTITITSTNPVALAGLRFRGVTFSTIPITSLMGPMAVPAVASGVGGPNAVILAHFAAGGGWASKIMIVNTTPVPVTVRVDLFRQDGNPLVTELNGQARSSFTGLVIPPQGVLVLAPGDGD